MSSLRLPTSTSRHERFPPLMDTSPAESQEETLLARFFETTPPTSLQPRPKVSQMDSSQESLSTRRTSRSRKPVKPASQSDCKAAGVRTKTAPGAPPYHREKRQSIKVDQNQHSGQRDTSPSRPRL